MVEVELLVPVDRVLEVPVLDLAVEASSVQMALAMVQMPIDFTPFTSRLKQCMLE